MAPINAWANSGVPMIFVTLPLMAIGLLPVIFIEAYIIKKQLNLQPMESVTASAIANALAIIVGIPVTWAVLLILQLVSGGGRSYQLNPFFEKFLSITWQATWLMPIESDSYWMVPVAMLVLFITFFFASWKIEYYIIKRINETIDSNLVNTVCYQANLLTYTLFALGIIAWLARELYFRY